MSDSILRTREEIAAAMGVSVSHLKKKHLKRMAKDGVVQIKKRRFGHITYQAFPEAVKNYCIWHQRTFGSI